AQQAGRQLRLDRAILDGRALSPVVAQGPGEFDNALAMNVRYAPIGSLRQQLQHALDLPLSFFKGWKPKGEAHVTVLTPVDFNRMSQAMKPGNPAFSMARIGEIANAERIQAADLTVLGLGRGQAIIDGNAEETYFVIVESRALRRLRRTIHDHYVAAGGDPAAFDPDHFHPHITVGYTKRDLHEADGVLKDLTHSQDTRFALRLK
ncbi:MAG: putative exported protein, partial [Rhodoferax sp.]|nr:putative exported protein [Rhodoferax sp.]